MAIYNYGASPYRDRQRTSTTDGNANNLAAKWCRVPCALPLVGDRCRVEESVLPEMEGLVPVYACHLNFTSPGT
jgi:hypothetical protein